MNAFTFIEHLTGAGSVARALPARKSSGGFTLIELLVVIAIIAVLAALLMPALRRAMESGRSAGCMSNLRSAGTLIINYANDHEDLTPPLWVQDERLHWHTRLIHLEYTENPGPNRPPIFLCPSHQPRSWTLLNHDAAEKSYAYGMRAVRGNHTYAKLSGYGGGFSFAGGGVRPELMELDFGSPMRFLFVADSILNHINPSIAAHLQQRYYFRAGDIVVYSDAVHLRHNGRGNFMFGDGHVESLAKEDLVGNYGAFDGTDAFVAGAIYEGPGFFQ
jgi:prepilin-type N-terminal cleavage/methylation domain-containing protein/prepilin-type processing-associated H-X9-DG protein